MDESIKDKNIEQALMLENRLKKRRKHLRKWAKRSNLFCYRLYDRDIPEIPLAIDFFEDENQEKYLVIALYERPYEKDQAEEEEWFLQMKNAASIALEVPFNAIFGKVRKRQKGDSQYEKEAPIEKKEIIVREQGQRFKINLSNYLDTGLFFDHRPLRLKVRSTCAKKRVLNLYCYTGAFSVYAATGKAKSICSVDLSNKYLDWAEHNMQLNGVTTSFSKSKVCDEMFEEEEKYSFINGDVFDFLYESRRQNREWDIIVLDPPTFSNSKKTKETLDINRDWPKLVMLSLRCLSPNGVLYFSTNSRRLNFDRGLIIAPEGAKIDIADISTETVPEDFRNTKIHRCWQINRLG